MSENERAPQSPTWTTRFHGGVGGEHSETSAWAHTVLRFAIACHTQNYLKTHGKLHISIYAAPSLQEESCTASIHWRTHASRKCIKHMEMSTFPHSHPITSQHSPASSRQPAVASQQSPGSDVSRSKEGVRRQAAEGP